LQKTLNRIVTLLFFTAVMLCLLQLIESLGIRQERLDVDLVRKLASIVIGLVPQGLVLLASVTFAIGIFRISKVGALVQTFNAVESFANVQVICMDKTGTLTQNKMTVRAITPVDGQTSEDALQTALGTYARFSSDKNATIRALEVFEPDPLAEPLFELPFSSRRKLSVLGVKSNGREKVHVLGALEILAERCDPPARESLASVTTGGGLEVYRNLLFGEVEDSENIDRGGEIAAGFRVRPICIVSLSDTVRPDAGAVIQAFEQKNIRFKILSGDSATSILATCRDIGWTIGDSDVISGSELDAMEDGAFQNTVKRKTVFARLKPEHKVRIVKAVQTQKLHTAMVGDGVNDVPAIKQADLGIAMDEGSAITKEVADIILIGNQFTLLPSVFEEGGKIINSVGAAAKLFLTKDFLVIYLTLLSALLLWTFPLTPRRLSFFNFFALGAPAIIIALFNTRAERRKRFLLDLLSFASISALIIAAAGYVGLAIAGDSSSALDVDNAPQMVMYSIMVVTSVASFLIIALGIGEAKRAVYFGYIAYSAALLLLYVVVANAAGSNKLVNWVKSFYEVRALGGAHWAIVIIVCVASGLVLIGIQKLRSVLVNRRTG